MRIEEQIVSIVRANTEGQKEVTLASDLRNDLHLDSFGTLMIINALEERFGISVVDGDFTGIATVADIVTLLRTKYGCQKAIYGRMRDAFNTPGAHWLCETCAPSIRKTAAQQARQVLPLSKEATMDILGKVNRGPPTKVYADIQNLTCCSQ